MVANLAQLEMLVNNNLEAWYNSSSKHLLSDHENVRNIRYAQEVFHIVETVGLGASIGQCSINRWLAEGLARRTRSLCLSA